MATNKGKKQKEDTTWLDALHTSDPLRVEVEQRVAQMKAAGKVITPALTIEVLVVLMMCTKLRRPKQIDTRISTILSSLKQHERDYFYHIICLLALIQTQGHMLADNELSNQLLQKGYGSLTDLNLFGLIDVRTEHQSLEYAQSSGFSFVHIHVQHFLAAINLLKSPVMETIKFIKNYILIDNHAEPETMKIATDSSMVLRFMFGLASTIFGESSNILLQNILKFLTQHINRDAPVIDSRVSILILQCLFEAQEISLYRQVQSETFVRQIFSFDGHYIENNLEAIAYYLLNTSSTENKQSAWTIYTHNKHKATTLMKKLNDLKVNYHSKTTNKVAPSDHNRVVISNKNLDYLITVLTDVSTTGTDSASFTSMDSAGRRDSASLATPQASSPDTSRLSSLSTVSTDTMSPFPPPSSASDVLSGPYGYLTKDQYESNRTADTTFFFNMVKDFVNPNFQMHCTTLVRTQYRKNDHIWFSFPPTMRHSFYECVEITPVVPMHWVKVPQPDGSFELEDRFREKFLTAQAAVPSTSNEVAELVVLNSRRMERIAIVPPSGGDPVMISIYRNSDLSEDGEVGCDYLMPFHQIEENVKWKKMDSFTIGKDQQIGRELPLPSKKGTELAEITTSTAAANIKDTTATSQFPTAKQPDPILGSSKLFARPLGEEPEIQVSEQQIKRWAMEGFDRPGFCFYGDDELFRMGYEYTLPERLPHTRTLREGGNGTVLEVFYEGTFYAVKRTAFRWREVLIMPKLKHKNILRLVTMLMGPPMKEYPRRRTVFQYFPRMTNDLGRSIGSYERYCLRTLKERYRSEGLLLSRIISNFKYVAREILSALHYLHTLPSPIVHRDVKPSNVLVKTDCSCANPLVCVCRTRPIIVISDFDASLELTSQGELIPDSTQSRSQSYYTSHDRLYHISPVGTIGFKSPEGFMHLVGNSLDVMPHLSTKADIFSFGLLMVLLFMNEDGPRYLSQVGTLLLSINQTTDDSGKLPPSKVNILKQSGITPREKNFTVTSADTQKILPINRLLKDFNEMPQLISFVRESLTIDPKLRPSAADLLQHSYITTD